MFKYNQLQRVCPNFPLSRHDPLSSGAGSGAQVAIGTGVLGGIVTATVLAVFLVPLFFLVVGRLFRLRKAPRTGNSPQIPTEQA
ncbi:efflux RND transporter permease subunit [Pseudomonas aeruginosa]|nr:efflux RND transporter permease subunit [Pseudomonas aeruginosa]MBI8598889.1 efflux RND transporter permease subunit [Pseudomonas aeruginosa]